MTTEFVAELEARVDEAGTPSEMTDALNDYARRIRSVDLDRSAELAARALAVATGEGYEHGIAWAQLNLAHTDLMRSSHDEALTKLGDALDRFIGLGDRSGEAAVLNGIGTAHKRLGDLGPAVECYEKSLAIWRELGDGSGEATALNGLGNIRRSAGEYEASLEAHRLALEIARAAGDEQEIAVSLNGIGNTYERLGDYAVALDHYHEGLVIVERIGDVRLISYLSGNIGLICGRLGDNRGSLKHELKSLAMKERLGDRWGMGVSYNNIGNTYKNLGDYASALEYHLKSLEVTEEIGDRQGEAVALNNLGDIRDVLGDTADTLDYFLRSMAISREIGDVQGEAFSLSHIGRVYRQRGDMARALVHYFKALRLHEQCGDRYGQREALNSIGHIYEVMHDPAKAEEYYRRSLAIGRETGDRHGEVEALLSLGWLRAGRGEQGAAVEHLESALAIGTEMQNKDTMIRALQGLSAVHAAAGDSALAGRHRAAFQELARELFNEEARNRVKDLMSHFEGSSIRREAELLGLGSEDLREVSEAAGKASRLKIDRMLEGSASSLLTVAQVTGAVSVAEAPAVVAARVRITTLGEFGVTIDGRELIKGDWQRKKARDLFKLLLINYGRAITVDEIVERLWGGSLDRSVELLVMNAVSHIRKALDPERRPHAEGGYLLSSDRTYTLDLGEDVWIDFLRFKELIVLARRGAGSAERRLLYEEAVGLYGGDFLKENLYDDWTASEREMLKDAFLDALGYLAESHLRALELDEAVVTARRILSHDDTSEKGYEVLMTALRDLGKTAELRKVFRECEGRFGRELGIEPPERLRRIAESARRSS